MRVLIAALLLCAACGGRTYWEGDPTLYGVDLVVGADPGMPAFVSAPDFRAQFRRDMELSARYFGHDPAGLAGLRVVLQSDWLSGEKIGAYRPDDNTIIVAVRDFPCLGATALPHELLHFFILDPNHIDRRWLTFGPLAQRIGCALYGLNARHPTVVAPMAMPAVVALQIVA